MLGWLFSCLWKTFTWVAEIVASAAVEALIF